MVNYGTMLTSVIVFVVSIILGSAVSAALGMLGIFIALIVFIASLCQTSPDTKVAKTISYECEHCNRKFRYAKECEKHERKCRGRQ